ncbi:hypothetical protein V1512DRAFT_264968 [Lipomyces arxii]|uniref:uncharacterized protein n=1 Tax=Lipomyces arxii TaxID=56418 RepID=UPI0034CEEBDF
MQNEFDTLGTGMSGLHISTGPQLHHQSSQQFDSYEPRQAYDSLLSRAPQYLNSQSDYGWKMNQVQPQQPQQPSWLSEQEYMPPRMPFLSQPYSTSPSSSYSPPKSDSAVSDSATVHSSSPQNRLQPRLSTYLSAAAQTQQQQQQSHPSTEQDDELIPTAIVIKNIPFAVKKEQLMELILSLGLTLPYAFNYHFDNGVFRGLAFANFATSEDTAAVINALNGHEIAGRKLRVEYKKMLPAADRERIEREKRGKRGQLEEQHRSSHAVLPKASLSSLSVAASSSASQAETSPTSSEARMELDLNDPDTLSFYSEILLFRDDLSREDLVFGGPSRPLHPLQRRNVHLLAQTMGLLHASRGDVDTRQVVISRMPRQYGGRDNYNYNNSNNAAGADNRLRGTKSFADIRSTSRLSSLYPSASSASMNASSALYGNQSLRAP